MATTKAGGEGATDVQSPKSLSPMTGHWYADHSLVPRHRATVTCGVFNAQDSALTGEAAAALGAAL